MATEQQEREAFEAWARANRLNLECETTEQRAAWLAWQARAALAAKAPAGWKLVPVEPTEQMMRAAVVYANGNAVYRNVAAEALAIEESIYGEVWSAMLAATPAPAPEATPAQAPEATPAQSQQADTTAILSVKVAHWRLRAEAAEQALAATKAEAKPLTNSDVIEGWRTTEAARHNYGWTSCEWFQAGVRFAQRHYGIGANSGGGNG